MNVLCSIGMMTAGQLHSKDITRFQFYQGTSNNLEIRVKRTRNIPVRAVPKGAKLSTFALGSMDI